ncbi:uncharacterized protein LOC134718860 [Mytilus trossulus]|uniref:uncharacterized protein LOC134718860 n=1 Tax=Mytilus trossulus TaxID=6551 RepID=UPI00300734EE
MKECVNCGTVVDEAAWFALDQQVATVTGAPVSVTVREGLIEIFQSRIDDKDKPEAGLCERCFNLLSVAISMKRTSSDALEKFISTSSNVHVKNLNAPLLYDHLNTEINTKLVLQEGVDWYSVIADIPKNNVICYGSTVAIEYINSIQDQINQFFSFCSDKAATRTESEIKETTSLSLDMSGSFSSWKNIQGTSLDNASVTSNKSYVESSIVNTQGNQRQGKPDEETDENVEKSQELEKEDKVDKFDDAKIKTGPNGSAGKKGTDSKPLMTENADSILPMTKARSKQSKKHVTLDKDSKDKPSQDQDGFGMDAECFLEIHVDENDQENFLRDDDGKLNVKTKKGNMLPDHLSDVSSGELDYEDSPQYEAEPVSTEDSDADSLPLHKKKSTKENNQQKICSKKGASQKKESNPKKLVSIYSEQYTSQSDNIASSEDEKYSVCENENIVCETEHELEETVDDITAPVLSIKGINSAIKALKDGRNTQFADQIVSGTQDKHWIRIEPRTGGSESAEDNLLSNPSDSVEKSVVLDLESLETRVSEKDVPTVIHTDQLESDGTEERTKDQSESDITGERNVHQSESDFTAERITDQSESGVTDQRNTEQSKIDVTPEMITDQSERGVTPEMITDQSEREVTAEMNSDQDGGRNGSLEKRNSREMSTDLDERTNSDDIVEDNALNQVDTLPSVSQSRLCRDSTETDLVNIDVCSKNIREDSVDIETLRQQMIKSKSDPGIDIEKISRRKYANSDSESIMSPEKEQENLIRSKSAVESYMKIINKMKEKQTGECSQKSIQEKSDETHESDKMNVFESPVLDEYIANNAFELSNVFSSPMEGGHKSVNNSEKLARMGRIMENVRARNYCKSKGERESTPKSGSCKTIPNDYINITSSNEKRKKQKSKSIEKSSKKNDAKSSKKKINDDFNVKNTDSTKKGNEEINSGIGMIKSPTGAKKCLFSNLGRQFGPDDIYAASTSAITTEQSTTPMSVTNGGTSNGDDIPSENISIATNLFPETEVKSEEESEYFKSVQEDIDISSYISKTKKKKRSKKSPKTKNRKSSWNMKVSIHKKDRSAKDLRQSSDSTIITNDIIGVSLADFEINEEKPVLSPQNVGIQNELQESPNIDPPNLNIEQEEESDMNELSVLTTDILQHLQPVVYLERLSENILNEYCSRSSQYSVETDDQTDNNSGSDRNSFAPSESSDKNGKTYPPLNGSDSEDLSVTDFEKIEKSKTCTNDKMVNGKLSLSKQAEDPEVSETGSHYEANMMKKGVTETRETEKSLMRNLKDIGDDVAKSSDIVRSPGRNSKDKAHSKNTANCKLTQVHKPDVENVNDINPAQSKGKKKILDNSIQLNRTKVSTNGKEVMTQRKSHKQKKPVKTTGSKDILQSHAKSSVTILDKESKERSLPEGNTLKEPGMSDTKSDNMNNDGDIECINDCSINDDEATDTEFPDENEEKEVKTKSSKNTQSSTCIDYPLQTSTESTGFQTGTNGEPNTTEDTTRQGGSKNLKKTSEDATRRDKDTSGCRMMIDKKDNGTEKRISENMESDFAMHGDKTSGYVETWSVDTESRKSVEGDVNNKSLQYAVGNTQRFELSDLEGNINTGTSIVENDLKKSQDEYENEKKKVSNSDMQTPKNEKQSDKVRDLTGFQSEEHEANANGEVELLKENSSGKALDDNIVASKKLTSLEHLSEQVVSATEVEANGLKLIINEIEPNENRTSFTENEHSIQIEDSQENEVNIEIQSIGENVTINESDNSLAVIDNFRNSECSDANTESDINTEDLDRTQNESSDLFSSAEDGTIVKIYTKRPDIFENNLSDDTDIPKKCEHNENSDSNTVISMTETIQSTAPNLEKFSEDINSTNNDPPFTKHSRPNLISGFSSGISSETENENHIEIPEKTAAEKNNISDTPSGIVETDPKDTNIFTCGVCGKKFGDEFAYHFHSMNKHQTSSEKDITSNTETRNKSVSMDTDIATIDTGKVNHGKKGFAKHNNHREIKSNVNWRRKIFERTGSIGSRKQLEDLETNENSESDENGNLEKREYAMPKKFRILKSSQWLDQHMNTDGKVSSSGESDIAETLSKISPVHKSYKKGNFNQTDLIIGYGVMDKVREVQREIVERSTQSRRMNRNSLPESSIEETTETTNQSTNSEAQGRIPSKRGRPRKKKKKRTGHSTKTPTKDDSTLSSDSLKIHPSKDSRKGYCSKQWKSALPTLSDSSDLPEEMVSPNEDVWFGNNPMTTQNILSESGLESESSSVSAKRKKKTSFKGIEYQAMSVRKSMTGKVMRRENLKKNPCVSSSEESCDDGRSLGKTNSEFDPCHTISKAPQITDTSSESSVSNEPCRTKAGQRSNVGRLHKYSQKSSGHRETFTNSEYDLNQINDFVKTGTESAEMSQDPTLAGNISRSNDQEKTITKKITNETVDEKHVDFHQTSDKNEILEKPKRGKGRQKKSRAISKQKKHHDNIFENFNAITNAKSPESVTSQDSSNTSFSNEHGKTVEESTASLDDNTKAIKGKVLEFKKSPEYESNSYIDLVASGNQKLVDKRNTNNVSVSSDNLTSMDKDSRNNDLVSSGNLTLINKSNTNNVSVSSDNLTSMDTDSSNNIVSSGNLTLINKSNTNNLSVSSDNLTSMDTDSSNNIVSSGNLTLINKNNSNNELVSSGNLTPIDKSDTNNVNVSSGYLNLIGSNIQYKRSPVSSVDTEDIVEPLTEIQMPIAIEADLQPFSFPINIDCGVSTDQTTTDNYVQPMSIIDNTATKDLLYPNIGATSLKTMQEDSCKLVNSLSEYAVTSRENKTHIIHTFATDAVVVESENTARTSQIESVNNVTSPHEQSNVELGNYEHKGNVSPNGTFIRKDKNMENKRTDFAFKRPAPVAGKKSNPCSDDNDSDDGKTDSSVPLIEKQTTCSLLETVFRSDAVSPPKRRNVMFVNLTSKKARELERKRKEEEKLIQNQPKKQNVPFFFPSKKRKIASQLNKTQNDNVCRQIGGPTPSKTIKLERLNTMKNIGVGSKIPNRETNHSIAAKKVRSNSQLTRNSSKDVGVLSQGSNKEPVYDYGAKNIGFKSQQQNTRGKHAANNSIQPSLGKMGFSRGKLIGNDGRPLSRENRVQMPQENFNHFEVKNIANSNQTVNQNFGGKNIHLSHQQRENSNLFGTCKDIDNLLPTIGNLQSNDMGVLGSMKHEQGSSSNNLFDFTDIFDVNIVTQDNFYSESTGLVIDNKSKVLSGTDLALITEIPINIPPNLTAVNNVQSTNSIHTQGNIGYKDMPKLYSAANIHDVTSMPITHTGGPMPATHEQSKLYADQDGRDIMPNLTPQPHGNIPGNHIVSSKLCAMKSLVSKNNDDHVIDFLDLDSSHADRILDEIETNPQPLHQSDHEKLHRRGKLRSLYMSHNSTTSGQAHGKLTSTLAPSQGAFISSKAIGNQMNMNNSGNDIHIAERGPAMISNPTHLLDNLIENENKKLVVSLQKLTDSDIQKQNQMTGLETMETEPETYLEEYEEGEDLPSLKPWHCALCNEQYRLKKELIRHISIVHEISQFDSRLRNYMCNMEGKPMSKNSQLLSDDIIKTGHSAAGKHSASSVTYADGNTLSKEQSALGHRDKIITIVDQDEETVNQGGVNKVNNQQSKIATNVTIDARWRCLICPMRFLTKIDVIQHVRMKHKQAAGESTPYEFEPTSSQNNQINQSASRTVEKSNIVNNPSFTAPRKVIRRKKEEKKKAKVKETSEILIISSKTNSIPFDIFRAPMDEPEELRQILSVKWYCKLCPNWYRLRKCCLQHVQKEHDIRGNWARFYFHNSQQVTAIPSMEICTGPHVDIKAYQFCIVCGRSYVDMNETTRHVRRNHGYIAEVHRTMCVQDKMDTVKIIVACDIFMDLHMYVVGSKSALLVQKDFFDELFTNCMSNNIRDFKDSDVAVARQLKRILFENGMINLKPSEQEMLGDVAHNYDVYKISFQEDFQWDRGSQKHGSTGGKMSPEDSDSSEDRDPSTSSEGGRNVSEETGTSDYSGKSDVVSLHRCHKCNLSFEDRMTLDKHNLTHKIQVRFSCRLCSKNFPKLFFLLQHLEVKHNQTQSTYFQFVLEHEQVIMEEAETEEQIMDQALEDESDSSNSAIINVQSGIDDDDDDQELDSDDVETTETRTCFVCGKHFETRLSLFTHLKDKHKIYKRKCLNCNKNFSCKTDLQKHFADIHDIDFVVDLSEQIFRCFVCDVIMESRSELKEHLPTHEKEGYNCNLCEIKYTAPSSLRFHKRTVHWKLEGTRSCKICDDKLFTNMKAYESHMLNHFYDFLGPMKCAKCNITCKNKKAYKQHIASHGVSLVCEHCGKVCSDQHALRHHIVTHNLSKKCEVCGKMLNKYSLKNHMTKVHGEKEKAACPHCGRLVNQSYMNAHIEEMHNKVKTFDERKKKVCDICGKVFKRPGLLKTHMVVHTGERPYVCEVCDRSFGYKTALNTHYATHKGFKPHKCKFCTSSFWLISQCKAHMKSDHGYIDPDLKHACHCCDKRFKHLAGLRLHMDETHPEMVPGPKFYPCHKCKKEFKYRKSLREHVAVCSPGTELGNLYRKGNDNSDSSVFVESQEPQVVDMDIFETFHDVGQNELQIHEQIISEQPHIASGMIHKQLTTADGQQIIIQEQSGDLSYQTIYIQSEDPASQGQVYVQDVTSQDQIILQEGNNEGEIIVALPDNCGEYNVDFLTSSNDIVQDGDIGYAEIIVQDQ